jgi:heptosyltransferase-2
VPRARATPAALSIPSVPDGQRRILLRLPNWLGDVVMAAPSVAAIVGARPEADFVAQVRAPFRPLAALLPGVRLVVPAGRDRRPGEWLESRKALRALDFDAAVVFPRSARAQLAPWFARVPVRLGFGGFGRKRLLTHPVTGWRSLRGAHRSRWFGALAQAFGAEPGAPWRIDVPDDALTAADRLLLRLGRRTGRPLIALEPGASYGPAKCWPADRFGELAARFLADGADVVTVGTEATRPLEAVVSRHAGRGLLRAAGHTPDLLALIGLLARADLLVTNDTGPMHLAAAVGTPLLALFGATDPSVSGPIGTGTRHLIYEPEGCSPCFLRDCPIAGHPCFTKLGVDRVHRAAEEMLGR